MTHMTSVQHIVRLIYYHDSYMSNPEVVQCQLIFGRGRLRTQAPPWPWKKDVEAVYNFAGEFIMNTYDTIRDVLKRKGQQVWSITPDSTVYRAIEMMADKHVGALLVIVDEKLVGIVSERDYARKVVLRGRSSRQTRVEEIMTSPVISVEPQNVVDECMRIITENRIRHLPVIENEKVIGVVSIGDLVNWIISAQHQTIQQLQDYITGKYPL